MDDGSADWDWDEDIGSENQNYDQGTLEQGAKVLLLAA